MILGQSESGQWAVHYFLQPISDWLLKANRQLSKVSFVVVSSRHGLLTR